MMLRPNPAQDAPPTSLEVGGFCYPVDWDYRTWIRIVQELEDWIDDPADGLQVDHNRQILCRIQLLAFGGILADEDAGDVLRAVADFARGYPMQPMEATGEALFDFAWDIGAIIIAIRNQSGIDLSYRRTSPFHWWDFLLEFQHLCGDHAILRLMEARAYRGSDPELLRRKNQCALPKKHKAADAARMAEINRLFYNA